MYHENIEIDLTLIQDPVKMSYGSNDVCLFQGISPKLDINSIPPSKFHEEIYHVYETGNHAKASLEYMKEGSLCTVIGDLGYTDAVDMSGQKYKKKCIKASTVVYKSYTKQTIAKYNQALFDHFA